MSRKRLGRLDPNAPSRARDAAEQAATVRTGVPKGPPIARMAAGVGQEIDAEIRRLKSEAEALTGKAADLEAAEAEGRVIRAVALDRIDTGHLTRDRRVLRREGEDWEALKASLTARGQQTPIELVELDEGQGDGARYGLISGFRRVSALRELAEETGEDRYARALALIRPAQPTPDKLIAMVEENEIRTGISFFERGRIAALAAAEGVFEDVDTAIDALFASSNRNRRYKIRCFVTVYEAVGERLLWPEAIGERLGIQLAKAIRGAEGQAGRGADLAAALDGCPERTEAQEMAILTGLAEGAASKPDGKGRERPDLLEALWSDGDGLRLRARARTEPGYGRVTLDIDGLADIDGPALEKLVHALGSRIGDIRK